MMLASLFKTMVGGEFRRMQLRRTASFDLSGINFYIRKPASMSFDAGRFSEQSYSRRNKPRGRSARRQSARGNGGTSDSVDGETYAMGGLHGDGRRFPLNHTAHSSAGGRRRSRFFRRLSLGYMTRGRNFRFIRAAVNPSKSSIASRCCNARRTPHSEGEFTPNRGQRGRGRI
jgi:hypothetical protein